MAEFQIVRVLECGGHGPLADVEERGKILNSLVSFLAVLLHPFQEQPVVVAHVVETGQLQKLAHGGSHEVGGGQGCRPDPLDEHDGVDQQRGQVGANKHEDLQQR